MDGSWNWDWCYPGNLLWKLYPRSGARLPAHRFYYRNIIGAGVGLVLGLIKGSGRNRELNEKRDTFEREKENFEKGKDTK